MKVFLNGWMMILIPDYPQWEADYHFLNWMEDDHYHHAKVTYKNDELIEYKEEIY